MKLLQFSEATCPSYTGESKPSVHNRCCGMNLQKEHEIKEESIKYIDHLFNNSKFKIGPNGQINYHLEAIAIQVF